MKFSYAILQKIAASCDADLFCDGQPESFATGVCIYQEGADCRKHILYISEDIPANSGGIFAVCRAGNTLFDTYLRIQGSFSAYEDWYVRMLEACTASDPVRRVLEVGLEAFHNPIAHFDRFGYLHTYVGQFEKPVDGTIWESVLHTGYAPQDFFTTAEWRNVSDAVGQAGCPVSMRLKRDAAHEVLATGVFVDGRMVGTLGVTDINSPFSDEQRDVLAIIRDVLNRVYSLKGASLNTRLRSSLIFERIVSGELVDKSQIASQLERLQWEENGIYRLMYFFPRSTLTHEFDYCMQYLVSHLPDCIYCDLDTDGLVIMPDRTYGFISDEEWAQYSRELERNLVSCIVGSSIKGFGHLRQAVYACQELKGYWEKNDIPMKPVAHYSSYYVQLLADRIALDRHNDSMVHPVLLAIFEKNDAGMRDWIEDLYTFLLQGGNVSRAAESRFIHRSTLTYHLDQLSKQLGTDIYHLSKDEYLYYLVSCMLLFER